MHLIHYPYCLTGTLLSPELKVILKNNNTSTEYKVSKTVRTQDQFSMRCKEHQLISLTTITSAYSLMQYFIYEYAHLISLAFYRKLHFAF